MFAPHINNVAPELISQAGRSMDQHIADAARNMAMTTQDASRQMSVAQMEADRNMAQSTLAGAQAMGQGIQQAGKSIGDTIWEFARKGQQYNQSAGTLQAMRDTGLLDKYVPAETLDKISQEKDPDKMRGQVEFMRDYANNQMHQDRQLAVAEAGQKAQMQYLNAQTNAAANLAAFKGTLPGTKEGKLINSESGIYRDYGSGPADPVLGPDGKILKPKVAANPLAELFGGTGPGAQPAAPANASVQAPASAAPAPGGLPVVKTKADFDALPSGAIYTKPDGSRFKKP